MSKYRVNALCVCGSGTVTSGMLLVRVQDILSDEGISCTVNTTSPNELETILSTRHVDLIITTTPLTELKGINCPIIEGHALLSGFGEENVIEQIKKEGKRIANEHDKPG